MTARTFAGWALQPGLRTVQGMVEDALATIFRRGQPPRLAVAGRTDAGVHATGQVAHVDLDPSAQLARRRRKRPTLAKRLNGIAGLDSDVAVHRSSTAPEGFDARFSAVWRRYEYRIADAAAPHDPLERTHTLWHPAVLDEKAMDAAARA